MSILGIWEKGSRRREEGWREGRERTGKRVNQELGEGKEKTEEKGKKEEGGSEKKEEGMEEKEMMISSPRLPTAFSFSYQNYEIWLWRSLETLRRILFLMNKKLGYNDLFQLRPQDLREPNQFKLL